MAGAKRPNQTMLPSSSEKRLRGPENQNPQMGNPENGIINVIRSVFRIPDDLVHEIFTFMPVTEAARMGLVSPKFKNCWMFSRKIHLGRSFAAGLDQLSHVALINYIVGRHSGPIIQSFRLFFNPIGMDIWLQKWIKKALEKKVEELDFEFSRAVHFSLDYFVDFESVKILRLSNSEVEFPPNLKGLSLLNTLVLKKINVTSETIDMVFNCCKLIETLELVQCQKIFNLKILAKQQKNFTVLKVGLCSNIDTIEIEAPSLVSLYYCGLVRVILCCNSSRINDVLLNLIPSRSIFTVSFHVARLVSDLANVEVLSVTSTFLEGLTPRVLDGVLKEREFTFWKLKEFQLFMEGAMFCNLYDIVCFLKNCPKLEKFFIDLTDFSFVRGCYWSLHQKQAVDQFPLSFDQLKFIKIKGFKFHEHELDLVKFFLEKATTLENFVLVAAKNSSMENSATFTSLLRCWKTSPIASIVIHEYLNDMSSVHPKHSKTSF